MKVALCGSHGIGKTTLVTKLYDYFQRTENNMQPPFTTQIEEMARSVAKDKGLTNLSMIKTWDKQAVEEFQWLCVNKQLQEEMKAEDFISDRSIVDVYAYTKYYGCSRYLLAKTFKIAYTHSKTYDVLFYVPVPTEMEQTNREDGFRLTDMESVWQVDTTMKHTLQMLPCDHVWLPLEREDWFDYASWYIEKKAVALTSHTAGVR